MWSVSRCYLESAAATLGLITSPCLALASRWQPANLFPKCWSTGELLIYFILANSSFISYAPGAFIPCACSRARAPNGHSHWQTGAHAQRTAQKNNFPAGAPFAWWGALLARAWGGQRMAAGLVWRISRACVLWWGLWGAYHPHHVGGQVATCVVREGRTC